MRTDTDTLPPLIIQAGNAAGFAWDEFIHGQIANEHTRRSYEKAARRFLEYCDKQKLELHQIAPKDVRKYLDSHLRHHKTGKPLKIASKKIHLAAIRHFFDIAVTRHAVILNPAKSVRGEKYQVIEGLTPEIGVKQAEKLFASIETSNVVGLRDRAIIGILIYTAARRGAVSKLTRGDFYYAAEQWVLRFQEKGGKTREIPVRHDLQAFITDYIDQLGHTGDEAPLFPTAYRKTKTLTKNPMSGDDIGHMVKRRIKDAGLPKNLSPHSFRATTATDLINQGVPLEDVQHLLGHADARTTKLYDRTRRKVTRNIVERISIRSDKPH